MTENASPDDVRELIRAIQTERLSAADQEQRAGWTKYVSLMVVVLALGAAMGSFKAAGFASLVVVDQAQASDTWASYQAKSIKQRLAEMEARRATGDEAARAAADAVRYRAEERILQSKAERLEAERDAAARHTPPLGFAIACLQIAIVLASICLITRRKLLGGAAALLGALGVLTLLYGLYGV